MEHMIEFDKTYDSHSYNGRIERIVVINYQIIPIVFRIVRTELLDGKIKWEYFCQEYWLESYYDADMTNIPLETLLDAWFNESDCYYWNHP